MNSNSPATVETLDYPVKIEFDRKDDMYIAEFLDLPGCSASGDTVEEAYSNAQAAKDGWMQIAREQGLPIPKPSVASEYSGRMLLRLPTSLHAMIADRAKMYRTSVNQYVVHLLSSAIVGDDVCEQLKDLRAGLNQCQSRISDFETFLREKRSLRPLQLSHYATSELPLSGYAMVVGGSYPAGIVDRYQPVMSSIGSAKVSDSVSATAPTRESVVGVEGSMLHQ
jgi:antitoxin HicB